MKSQHTVFAVLLAAALSLGAVAADAQATVNYDFDTVAGDGTPTTLQGATFSSPQDATTPGGAFEFAPNPGLYSTISATTVLTSYGYAATLDISFAQAESGVSFEFAGGDTSGDNDLLTVTANTGQSWTVSPTVSFLYPEGLFSIASVPAFTSLAFSETYGSGAGLTQDSLTIADMSSAPVPVPLPPSALLLAGGLAGLGWKLRRTTARA
jgi:hypothetical protein